MGPSSNKFPIYKFGPTSNMQDWCGNFRCHARTKCVRAVALEAFKVCERTADRPESWLTNSPGHLWRGKWTALIGPSHHLRFRFKNMEGTWRTQRQSPKQLTNPSEAVD